MNTLILDSWLREYLNTKAKPKQIAKYLSLCSQSVEKIIKVNGDKVYDIEVTTNRPDCLSIYGIARELAVILPRFGIAAHLKKLPMEMIPKKPTENLPLQVKISHADLCPRFTALIFDQVVIGPSAKTIRQRLEKSGIRSINNVVDVSNYLMLELGQPMHTFDYDKIGRAKMFLRESKVGEKITTLDGQTRKLPPQTIVIEDGEGKIIDLCGIMGGKNSQVSEKTKRVLLFIQTYNPSKIRQTCQRLAFQTEAAKRFEKGIEPEGVIPAMRRAIKMLRTSSKAVVASRLIDIYPHPPKKKKIILSQQRLNQLMGIEIKLTEAKKILKSLGFKITINQDRSVLNAVPPYWRQGDISLPEDLIEEVARIYGYYQLPSVLPSGQIPQQPEERTFYWENKVKAALKFWGFWETVNYSMIGANLLRETGFSPCDCLEIANPLTKELVFLRPSLIPSLLKVETQDSKQLLKIFELSKIYLPRKSFQQLPGEKLMLTGVVMGEKFFQVKGIVEALLEQLNIFSPNFKSIEEKDEENLFHPFRTASVLIQNQILGKIGEINPAVLRKMDIQNRATVFDLDFQQMVKFATKLKKYQPLSKYPAIVEDLTFVLERKTPTAEIVQLIKAVDSTIQNVILIDDYRKSRTFRITYQNSKRNLKNQEIKKIRKEIITQMLKDFGAKIKEKSD